MGYFTDESYNINLSCINNVRAFHEHGYRSCSLCRKMKYKDEFNAEEVKKRANVRCCNQCAGGFLIPKDLNKMTIIELKIELRKRGQSKIDKVLKAELVALLRILLDAGVPPNHAPVPEPTPKPKFSLKPATAADVASFFAGAAPPGSVQCKGVKADGTRCKVYSAMPGDHAAPLGEGALLY